VDNVSSTHVAGNRLGATGSTTPITYGITTSSPLVRGGNIWTDGFGETKPFIAYTANSNVDAMYSGGLITNRAAAGNITLTLPTLTANITDGMTFTFMRIAGFNVTLSSAQTITLMNGGAATPVLTGTTDQVVTLVAMGIVWYSDMVDNT
jgi:hypothetical protein